MTSIEKLHITGVRSFNPDPAERQTITFHKPLTIILGKNGAGKTTIIESLLNATTGEMPPGASAGEKNAFVYDPKAAGESEVKAQIRLMFTGKGGKAMQVIRSFQVTRPSRGKVKFETLDSVLACKEEATGKVQSATYRSSDCDRLVPDMLGVPKAVLEHVIFCHQEDCNWPLGPPGEVKKRFDDIFASTRYVAALDMLRETGKEYKDQLKQTEAVLITLREHREQARTLSAEVAEKEEQVRLIQARSKEIEPRLQQLSAAVAAIDSIAHRAETMTQELSAVRGRLAEKERAVRALQQQRQATGHAAQPQQSLDELRVLLRDYNSHVKAVGAELEAATQKLSTIEASRRAAESRASSARASMQVLEQQAVAHARNVAELQRSVAAFTSEFVAGEDDLDEPALRRIEAAVNERVATARAALQRLHAEHAEALRAPNSRRDEALRTMDAEAKERDLMQAQMTAAQAQIKAIQESRPTVGPPQRAALQREVDALVEKQRAAAEARRAGQASAEMQGIVTSLEAAQLNVATLSAQLARSRVSAEAVVRMGMLRATVNTRQAALGRDLSGKVVPGLREAGAPRNLTDGPEMPKLRDAVEAATSVKVRKQKAMGQVDEEARAVDHDLTSLTLQLKDVTARRAAADSELVAKRSVVASAVGAAAAGDDRTVSARLTAVLAEAEEKLLKASRRLTSLQSLSKCYESFIAAAKQDHACVVCKRGLDTAGVESFVKINEERQRTTPEQIQAAKDEQSRCTDLVERLRRAVPVGDAVAALEEEVPRLAGKAAELERDVAAKRAAHADLTTKRRELQRQLEGVDALLALLGRLEADAAETQRLSDELSELQTKHQGSDIVVDETGRPVPQDVLQQRHDDATAEVQRLNARLLQLQRATATSDDDARVDAALQAKRGQLADAELACRRAEDADARLAEIAAETEKGRQRVKTIAERRAALAKAVDEAAAQAAELERVFADKLAAAHQTVQTAERDAARFAESARAVKEFFAARHGDKMASGRAALRAAEQAIAQCDEEIREAQNAIRASRATIDNQHQQRQALSDGVRLLEMQEEVARDQVAVARAEAELKQLRDERTKDVVALLGPEDERAAAATANPIAAARDRCRAKAAELDRQRAQHSGALETLLKDVNDRTATLAKDKYRDVDKRYSSTFIKVQTTELAIEDMEKYYRALEKAVSSYHAEKVAQINKIVAELWRATYRGSDIDSIEIRSEDESGSMARRSYKYRVVMRRGDTELDMRGRCSAGQKVLASVIIRMALSEAFCCDCGILALDEPTTNLDDDNAKALAESLRELIAARRAVSHFQLVVITHDEEFVKTLGANHRADSFYYVQKDREGTFSTIQERRFGDLFL